MSIGLILLIVAVLVMGVAGSLTWASSHRRSRFDVEGSSISAEVTNLNTGRISGVVFNSPAWYVGYRYFTTAPGQDQVPHAGYYPINEDAYNHLKVGDHIQVVYLASQPDVSRPAPELLDAQAERNKALGLVYFAAGIALALALIGVALLSQEAQRQTAVQTVDAQQSAQLAEVQAAVKAKLPDWRKAATYTPVRLSAIDAGFSSTSDTREVYYGNCKARQSGEQRFYLYVVRYIYSGRTTDKTWLAQGYSYTPGSDKAADCMPEDWTAVSDKVADGDWHDVIFIYPAQVPFYKLTAQATPLR